MSANDNYFQKLIDLKLEAISKMMSHEPNRKRSIKTSTSRKFNNQSNNPRTDDDVLRRSLNRRTTHNLYKTSFSDFNFLSNSDPKEVLMNRNSKHSCKEGETNDAENTHPSEKVPDTSSCSVAGLILDAKCSTGDPEFKADIVSKLKSKAIRNLLFKAREDINVKKLNEMKTKPEKVAENALLMCDLKSYGAFVDELFSSGVFPVFRDKSIDLGNDKKIDYQSKQEAARRDMENLERIAGRVFGDGFVRRSNYYNGFQEGRN